MTYYRAKTHVKYGKGRPEEVHPARWAGIQRYFQTLEKKRIPTQEYKPLLSGK
jgi:hypothetical protein